MWPRATWGLFSKVPVTMDTSRFLIHAVTNGSIGPNKTMDNKETGLETCWRDRRNLVEICDVTKIFDLSAIIHPVIPVQK